MFRRFTAPSPPGSSDTRTRQQKALDLFRLHPAEISALLELSWELRIYDTNFELGRPNRRSDISQLPDYLLNFFPFADDNRNLFAVPGGDLGARLGLEGSVLWDHLIYAYLIENTRIFEILRRVIYEYRHGEKLGVPLASSQHWLRNTEELFFRDPAPFTIYSISSYIRPDSGATRRNAYYRMFGMDLNHGMDDGKEYPYVKPEASNREFVNTLEEFLREVWQAIENQNNTSGSNPQDDAAISDLLTRLHDMLMAIRTNGNISREEFWAVSMMSWFHLTVEFNSPIVASVRAEAFSEEERLIPMLCNAALNKGSLARGDSLP